MAKLLQGLGLEYCKDLVQRGCKLLVVTSRTGVLPAAAAQAFAAAGVQVVALSADAANPADMARVLGWVREELPFIQHYAHAAGVSGFDMLQDLQPAAFWQVANTKVVGASALGAVGLPVNSQLLLSSTSAVWSQTGAAHYAAANAFLDGLAAQRQHAGLPGTALQLGPFAGAGMAADHVEELAAIGLRGLNPRQLWEGAWAAGTAPNLVFARIDAPRFAQLYTAKGRWSLVDSMLSTPETAGPQSVAVVTAAGAAGGSAPPHQEAGKPALSPAAVEELVRRTAGDILGTGSMQGECIFATSNPCYFHLVLPALPALEEDFFMGSPATCPIIDTAQSDHASTPFPPPPAGLNSFPAGGFDSLSAVELSSSLSTSLGVDLPGTLVFDYPSVSAMTQHICSLLQPAQAVGPAAAVSQAVAAVPSLYSGTAAAGTGSLINLKAAARLPAGYTVVDASMHSGADFDGISLVPHDRWNLEALRVRPSAC